MKICIIQVKSLKGEVEANIKNHLNAVKQVIKFKTDLIIFPELSITGYEPNLAKELVRDVDDKIFNPFQKLADENATCIGIGMPTHHINGINISMMIFQPNKKRIVYSKRILHTDELPYFKNGTDQPFLNINGKKIAIGICYETLQREHFINAIDNEAEIYIASVAKSKRGIEKAYLHFPSIAKEFGIPILMSNCVGYCDNFLSNGKSSIWNNRGRLINQLDEENQGVLIYDTELDKSEDFQFKNE